MLITKTFVPMISPVIHINLKDNTSLLKFPVESGYIFFFFSCSTVLLSFSSTRHEFPCFILFISCVINDSGFQIVWFQKRIVVFASKYIKSSSSMLFIWSYASASLSNSGIKGNIRGSPGKQRTKMRIKKKSVQP